MGSYPLPGTCQCHSRSSPFFWPSPPPPHTPGTKIQSGVNQEFLQLLQNPFPVAAAAATRRRNQRPHDLQRRRPHCPRVLSDSPSDKEAGEVLPRNRYTRPRSVLVVTQPQPLSRHKIPPTRRKEGKGEGGNAGGAKAAETELVSARSGQSTFGEFLKEPHADHARAPLPLLPRPYLATSRKAPAGSNDQLPAWRACPKTARCYYGLTETAEKKLSTLISNCLEGATLARPSHNQMRFYVQKREREKNKLGDKKSTSGDQKSSVLTSRLVSLQI